MREPGNASSASRSGSNSLCEHSATVPPSFERIVIVSRYVVDTTVAIKWFLHEPTRMRRCIFGIRITDSTPRPS